MAYDSRSYRDPFWAQSGNFVRGRDPLGIQNSSISVYSTLLPGMTNLTLRLRYYGMYLWLLDEYHQLPPESIFKQKSTVNGQYTFIRRAELLIAFLMANKFPKELSVTGSEFAYKNLNQVQQLGYYDIALGADKLSTTERGSVYWDYTSGALGQYYAGSLINLKLMVPKNGFFERTVERGVSLANAYRSSISTETQALFLLRITQGKLYQTDLDQLLELALNKPLSNTVEGAFYLQLLLQNDTLETNFASSSHSKQRKESLLLFMEHMKAAGNVKEWRTLPQQTYISSVSKSKNEVLEATWGWYFYYLNELIHYSLEGVFWGLLYEIEHGDFSLSQFITHISTAVDEYCQTNSVFDTNTTVEGVIEELKTLTYDALEFVDGLAASVKSKNSIEGVVNGLVSLLALYIENAKNIHELSAYAESYALDKKYGNAVLVFQNYIEANSTLNFKAFVAKVVQTLLTEHIAIAYNKMGNGEKNLLKFIIEDNYLIHIETMEPNFTNPRLRTLFNFTIDLGLMNAEGELTVSGEELLLSLKNEL